MTKKSYSTLTIAAAAAVLMLLAGGAAQAQTAVNDDPKDSSAAAAVQLEDQTRIIEAPMCFLPRFSTAEQRRCSVVGYIVRRVGAALELDD